MPMPYIPYSCQNIDEADIEAVTRVLRSEYLTQGPAVSQFESEFAARHEVAHAVAVANATAGLHIACLALGVQSGSVVWTSPISFLASANCARYCNATIGFVDIDARTRNMSVAALQRKLETTPAPDRPQVVIPVAFSGMPCDLREIRALADQYQFKILEDAAHATGASYLGRPIGSHFSDATVFSFHPVKIVTTAEGGLVTTQSEVVTRKLQLLRAHGMTRDSSEMVHAPEGAWYYEQHLLGFNYRLTDLQAALGSSQLRRLEALHQRRIELADRYDQLFSDLPVILPARSSDRLSAWHLYVIEVDEARTPVTRQAIFSALRSAGIGANVHYIPIHLQPYYASQGFKRGDYPAAEAYYRRAISIPLYPQLSEAQQEFVVETIRESLRA